MSCPRMREIGRALSPRELRAFCDHALRCADCSVLLDRVEHTYRVLRSEPIPSLPPSRRVMMLSRIEALAPFESRISRTGMSIGLAGLAVALCLAFWPAAEQLRPRTISREAPPQTPPALTWEPILTPLDPWRAPLELSPLSSPRSDVSVRGRRIASTAERVLAPEPIIEKELAPPPVLEISVRELLSRADELRRSGKEDAAAKIYLDVAARADGGEYAEEALLRTAQIFADEKLEDQAFGALHTAAARFPHGMLTPERAVLEAQLHLARGDARAASKALERIGDRRTLAMSRARVEVAEALLAVSPARAIRLVAPVLDSEVPDDLLERARMIDRSGRGNR